MKKEKGKIIQSLDSLQEIKGRLVLARALQGMFVDIGGSISNFSPQLANFVNLLEEQLIIPFNKCLEEMKVLFPDQQTILDFYPIDLCDIKNKIKTTSLSAKNAADIESQLVYHVEESINHLIELVSAKLENH